MDGGGVVGELVGLQRLFALSYALVQPVNYPLVFTAVRGFQLFRLENLFIFWLIRLIKIV